LAVQLEFDELFHAYYPKVFRLCRGYFNGDEALAADAAQEVFIRIWEKLASFRHEASLGTWVYRIAVNVCLMQLRQPAARHETRTTKFPPVVAETYNQEEEDKLRQMYACIQQLDQASRLTILMVLEGEGYEKIAEVVGVSEDALRVRIHRIKKKLTQCVQHGNQPL
jgi:RNA polymerase sigma factor (sigma-70 family)